MARPGERRVPKFRLRTEPGHLLAAALEHFSTTSYRESRVVDITRRLGLSQAALYMHFASKQALFDRVIEEFCLPQDVDAPATEGELAQMLGDEPAVTVLRIVLREWASAPAVALQYLEAISSRLEAARLTPSVVREVASSALGRATTAVIFAPVAATDGTDG